jgi:succinate-semialdehyde dehydrogenase / glutarate-semialdehyde dehydrogenase
MSLTSQNPYTGETINIYSEQSEKQLDNILNNAEKAYQNWQYTDISVRAEMMHKLAKTLRQNKLDYATLMSMEMGKCITEAMAEVEKSAWVCEYYAENTADFLQSEQISTQYSISKVIYQPIGTILAIMPWNFPFWQVFRFAAPNIMAGNTGILKHASNVSGCSLAIEQAFLHAGFPEHVFQSVLVKGANTAKLISDPRIAGVTLTGSTEAGKKVAEIAGKALKKTVLELGGSDPYLILADANIEQAAKSCTAGRLLNAGQSCIGAKRFIVLKEVYDDFLDAFTKQMSQVKFANPLLEDTKMGSLANQHFRNDLHHQVERSIKAGAKLHLGGFIPDEAAAFYPPSILIDVKPGMPAYHDELFGPVASVIKAENIDEAIHIANDSIFGLGAAIFSQDIPKAEFLAEKIQAGAVFINDFVKSDPRLPFGGVKQSGYGRELSLHGFREFLNIKTVAG